MLDPALQGVVLGSAILGATCGSLGALAVVRRESLLGDAVSHAAVPGVAIGYMLFGPGAFGPWVGAALTGWLCIILVQWFQRRTVLPADAAIAASLSGLFGLGLVLLQHLSRNDPAAAKAGLSRFLYGQAATMLDSERQMLALVGVACWAVLWIFWRPIKASAFDPEFARAVGYRPALWDAVRRTLIVVAVVSALPAVGAILISALLVAPAVGARAVSRSLVGVVIGGGLIGGISGLLGSYIAGISETPVPTGPAVVLLASGIAVALVAISRIARRTGSLKSV